MTAVFATQWMRSRNLLQSPVMDAITNADFDLVRISGASQPSACAFSMKRTFWSPYLLFAVVLREAPRRSC